MKTLKTSKISVLTACVFVLALGTLAHGQDQAEDAARRQEAVRRATIVTPLRVDVVISRISAESGETISRLPYTLLVNANDSNITTLNMGAEVPVPTMMTPTVDGKPAPNVLQTGPVTYRSVGTNINIRQVRALEGGRFAMELRIEDSSVYDEGQNQRGAPVFRSFRASNNIVLRDGQSIEFTAAADRVSGEVVRAEVTLEVLE